tara:strand:+ start:15695 stop:15922 length:228 start_codon:yes stop_codon:yes gene_type:complete
MKKKDIPNLAVRPDWLDGALKTDKRVPKGKIMKPDTDGKQHKVVEESVNKKKVKEKDVFGSMKTEKQKKKSEVKK